MPLKPAAKRVVRPNVPTVPREVAAAFTRLERAKLELELFRQKNYKVIDQIDELRAELDNAHKECAAMYSQYHPILGQNFNGFSTGIKRGIDADLLVRLMPDAVNLVKFSLTIGAFNDYVEKGVISEDVAEQVQTSAPTIVSPRK